MTNIYWLEQTIADVPPEDCWLADEELACLKGLPFEKRRSDWRLGRWTAKRAVAAYQNLPDEYETLRTIRIVPAPSGAPEVQTMNCLNPPVMSLSHSDGVALCTVAQPGVALGCDLEIVQPRDHSFVEDYFTNDEQTLLEHSASQDRWVLLTVLWSAKESALKAIREGLRLDTRSVSVSLEHQQHSGCVPPMPISMKAELGSDLWRPLRVSLSDGRVFAGWWRSSGHLVRTQVTSALS